MNIANKAVTTAVVVDSPTPLAPPVVVKPHVVPIAAIKIPKILDLIKAAIKSQGFSKFCTELRNMVAEMPYIESDKNNAPAMPVRKPMIVKIGNINKQAIALGVAK